MNDIRLSFLSAAEMPTLHQTFLAAFADYVVPIQLSAEQFRVKVRREGVEPSFCVGAFAGDSMVGFILTGLGEWQGKPAAYNAGTGVLPAYRGRKLTQRMYAFLLPKLRESGVTHAVLEVIQENTPALKSYQHVGFEITRSLDCFRGMKEALHLRQQAPEGYVVRQVHKYNWDAYESFGVVSPTWQNMLASIKRGIDSCVVLEAYTEEQQLCGYIVFNPQNGSVAQLAVAKSHRCNGIGTALLQEAVKKTVGPAMLFINIESTAAHFLAWLQRRQFKLILRQYEMQMPIT